MNTARIIYRTRQVLLDLGATLSPTDWDLVENLLNPSQVNLFRKMQKSEQTHSVRVLKALLRQGENHPDLMVAALLHDVGKSCFTLKLWERILVVLVKALLPSLAQRWGCESPITLTSSSSELRVPGWRRAFVIACQHPLWGAELVAKTGATPLSLSLIQNHQEEMTAPTQAISSLENRLLRSLQAVDDES
jgi:hypothetical protein